MPWPWSKKHTLHRLICWLSGSRCAMHSIEAKTVISITTPVANPDRRKALAAAARALVKALG